jgi:hypothetical protein
LFSDIYVYNFICHGFFFFSPSKADSAFSLIIAIGLHFASLHAEARARSEGSNAPSGEIGFLGCLYFGFLFVVYRLSVAYVQADSV